MKRLLLIPLLLLAGCAKQEVVKTKTVYESTKVVRIVPKGTISQDQCSKLSNGLSLRMVLDHYGWPHTQDYGAAIQDLIDFNMLSYPPNENSANSCKLRFSNNTDPDKAKLIGKNIVLK